jgi:murein DD-endopeptidase MepM/ murein hydrolase activator NlpD
MRARFALPAVLVLIGFAAGAFTTALLVWRFGNFIGARDPQADIAHASPVRRWIDRLEEDDVTNAVVEGTPAVASPAAPPPVPAGTSGLVGDLPEELVDRDLDVPVEGIERDTLVQSFDQARGGGSRRHQAIDILAPRNTPVIAVEDGTIARLFKSAQGGLTVYQYDPSGRYVYYYAHLERYARGLDEGDYVERGQVIGYVGTSGNAPPDTPHLHFAIFQLTGEQRWWEGTPLDPYVILKKDR